MKHEPRIQNIPIRTEAGREIRQSAAFYIYGERGLQRTEVDCSWIEQRIREHLAQTKKDGTP